jgi:hypothetical protein
MFMAVNDTAIDDRGNVQKAIDLKARLGDPFFLEHVFADAIGKAVATIDALVASYEVAARECKVAEQHSGHEGFSCQSDQLGGGHSR